jgi:hypothetical protein
VAICASNRSSSSLSRGSSVPRRVSVACSTPSSLVPGDDYGDAAGCRTGTGRPCALDRRWPHVPIWLRGPGTPVTIHTLGIREGTSPRVREETSRRCDRDRNPQVREGPSVRLSPPIPSSSDPGKDRESFQARLRSGTLGGRIRTVKRSNVTARSRAKTPRYITHRKQLFAPINLRKLRHLRGRERAAHQYPGCGDACRCLRWDSFECPKPAKPGGRSYP